MPDDGTALAGTEVHYLLSQHVGDEFKLFVGHCGTAADDAAPAPVLYLTDANGTFGSAIDIIRTMQLARHLPPLLVVGIGYRLGELHETIAVRTRDLTPSVDESFAELFPEQKVMGGAPALLAFIHSELKPWVQARYRVDANDAAYFGHSFGGLFGTYVLLTAPQTFQRYGLGSPSLWWDNGVMSDYEARYAEAHDDLPAKVFFGIGAHETHEGRQREAARHPPAVRQKAAARHIDMVEEMQRLVKRLKDRCYPSLTIASAVFPDEFHVTVPHLNLSRALRFLFEAPR
jgi:predicted alpha/beta superfamily hydrolase